MKTLIGIYEKALPKDLDWAGRLAAAKAAGYDFVEMAIDESDERLARLDMPKAERKELAGCILDSGLRIPSMCLSGHRRFPFGSRDAAVREKAREMMRKAIDLSLDLGIRTIQLAGYDVYYEPHDKETEQRFLEGMEWSANLAASKQVMLAMEIMDTAFMSSLSIWKWWDKQIASPWFTVYPDVGNLTAWNNDVEKELDIAIDRIAAIHLKETKKVTHDFPGQFRDMRFGDGDVDFDRVFRTLKQIRYRGAFLIEMWTEKAPDPLREVAEALHWIKDRMRAAGWPE